MPSNLPFALAALGVGGVFVWAGITDPEDGVLGGLRSVFAGDPVAKRAPAVDPSSYFQTSVLPGVGTGADSLVSGVIGATQGVASSAARQHVIATARTWLGVPYLYGGRTRAGADCSGFTQAVYSSVGVHLPRVSFEQATQGVARSSRTAQPGDLIAFGAPVHHVGIYLGGNQIIHEPHPGAVCRVETIWTYEPHFFRDVLDGPTHG